MRTTSLSDPKHKKAWQDQPTTRCQTSNSREDTDRTDSERAQARQTENGTRAEHVAQAGHTQHRAVAHATEHCATGQSQAHIFMLDREGTDGDRDDIATDHDRCHFRTPLKG